MFLNVPARCFHLDYATTVNDETTTGTATFVKERMAHETTTQTQLLAAATAIREAVRRFRPLPVLCAVLTS